MASELIGVRETIAAFGRVEIEAQAALRLGGLAAGEVLKSQMQAAAPKLTGRLAASITVRETEGGVEVGTTVPYGRFVQFGTRYMSAEPFESQAAAEAEGRVAEVMAAVFKRMLR